MVIYYRTAVLILIVMHHASMWLYLLIKQYNVHMYTAPCDLGGNGGRPPLLTYCGGQWPPLFLLHCIYMIKFEIRILCHTRIFCSFIIIFSGSLTYVLYTYMQIITRYLVGVS